MEKIWYCVEIGNIWSLVIAPVCREREIESALSGSTKISLVDRLDIAGHDVRTYRSLLERGEKSRYGTAQPSTISSILLPFCEIIM